MRWRLVRSERRSIDVPRHGADGITQIPAVENQIQLLPTPALDIPPELTHRIRVVVAAGKSHLWGPNASLKILFHW